MRKRILLLPVGLLLVAGCEEGPRAAAPPAAAPAAAPTPQPLAAVPEDSPPAEGGGAREAAAVGVGARGRGYRPGYLSSTIRAYFRVEQQVEFIKLQKTMDIFKATHGRAPESQEEFDREIIEAGLINLPQLPEGDRYVYDPEAGELMVEHPAP